MYFYTLAINNLKLTSENNSIYNSIKKNKIQQNKFNKEVQDKYTENYKTLKKKIKGDLNKWKHILCTSNVRLNIDKTTILLN